MILFQNELVTIGNYDDDGWIISFNNHKTAVLLDDEEYFIDTLKSFKNATEQFVEWKKNQIRKGRG
tara:strand:- start:150 stop:347 length:198 start_codon:yes stop_codon:yes gene_type:complete